VAVLLFVVAETICSWRVELCRRKNKGNPVARPRRKEPRWQTVHAKLIAAALSSDLPSATVASKRFIVADASRSCYFWSSVQRTLRPWLLLQLKSTPTFGGRQRGIRLRWSVRGVRPARSRQFQSTRLLGTAPDDVFLLRGSEANPARAAPCFARVRHSLRRPGGRRWL